MTRSDRFVALAFLALASSRVQGADIVACIVADTQNNSSYYGMATTVTRLKCEFTDKDYYPTLPELYRQGWRLIQVLGGDHALSQGTRGPSPLYLLEREAAPAPPAASAAATPNPPAAAAPKSPQSPAAPTPAQMSQPKR
jgi:hypothetical protein